MAETDIYTKNYISQNTVFADVFNFFVFGGDQVIRPDALRDESVEEIAVVPVGEENGETVQRYRDVLKSCVIKRLGGVSCVLLGVENQASEHNAMPVRNGTYDFLQYTKQVSKIAAAHKKDGFKGMSRAEFLSGFTTKDRLIPVITLVIYFGAEKWNAPRSLHEMFDDTMCDKRLMRFVPDYPINLIEPAALSKEDLETFVTDFGQVMEFLKYSNDKQRMTELLSEGSPYETISTSAALVLNSCTGMGIKINQKEEKTNMCKAILEMRQESRIEGEARGVEKGRKEGRVEGEIKGVFKTLYELVRDNLLSLANAAKKAGQSEEEFTAGMSAYFAQGSGAAL